MDERILKRSSKNNALRNRIGDLLLIHDTLSRSKLINIVVGIITKDHRREYFKNEHSSTDEDDDDTIKIMVTDGMVRS